MPTIETVSPPPVFAECVSNNNRAAHSPNNSRQLAQRLQELIDQIQQQPNPASRVLLQDCLESLLTFYGDGLARVVQHLRKTGPDGEKILVGLLKDASVSGLLLIHGLHPIPLETRLARALDSVRPYMQSHGGNIELLGLENEIARVRLQGTCKTCPSSAVTLELAVRRAVEEACPDLRGFEVVTA
jgi:Fe-S cluster biogenesis protein NfuA